MPTFYYRVDVRGRYQNQDIVNTFFYEEVTLNPEYNGNASMADAFATQFNPSFSAISVASCEYKFMRVIRFDEFGLQKTSYIVPYTVSSGRDVAGLPSFVTGVIQRAAYQAGTRRFRGKLCIAGIAQVDTGNSLITPGTPTATALSAMATRMRGTLQILNTEGGGIFLARPVIGNFRKRLGPLESYQARGVGQTLVRDYLGTQRHRALGHGRRG